MRSLQKTIMKGSREKMEESWNAADEAITSGHYQRCKHRTPRSWCLVNETFSDWLSRGQCPTMNSPLEWMSEWMLLLLLYKTRRLVSWWSSLLEVCVSVLCACVCVCIQYTQSRTDLRPIDLRPFVLNYRCLIGHMIHFVINLQTCVVLYTV